MTREWILTINAPDVWLTANKPKSRYERSRLAAAWRLAAYVHAQSAKLPKGLDEVHIRPIARFPLGKSPVRDAPNLSSTVKAAVDGLGPQDRGKSAAGTPWIAPGYGLVPDDNDKHVTLEQVRIGEPLSRMVWGYGQLLLVIREVIA